MSQLRPSTPADRERVLARLEQVVGDAWASFDTPRATEPELNPALAKRMRSPLPELPGDAEEAVADAAHLLDTSVSPCRPLFLAYIGSSGLEMGVLAAALTATYDTNLATSAGGADLVESQTLAWLAEFIGFPTGDGVFTSGGMTSNLTALLAAREARLPGSRAEGVSGRRAAVYCSEEAHHSIVRAVEACGLGTAAVRRVPTDGSRRMRPDLLRAAVRQDLADATVPVAVVATGGTTLTGAVDPIDRIADVCAEHGIWLHIDGAYGLPAAATATAAPLFRGLDRADSCSVDAHKWLGVPKSCSAVLMRERGSLEAAFGHQERYMLREGDISIPVDRTLEYSRPLRSLRLWMCLRVYGAEQYRGWIEGCLANARALAELVRASDGFELLNEPMLSTVCFRHVPTGVEDLDEHNVRLAWAIAADGRVYLAPAVVDGSTCLRVCFVNFRTTADAIPLVLEVARALGDRLAAWDGAA